MSSKGRYLHQVASFSFLVLVFILLLFLLLVHLPLPQLGIHVPLPGGRDGHDRVQQCTVTGGGGGACHNGLIPVFFNIFVLVSSFMSICVRSCIDNFLKQNISTPYLTTPISGEYY